MNYFFDIKASKETCYMILSEEFWGFQLTFFLEALQNYKLLFIFAQRKSKIIYILSDFCTLFATNVQNLQVQFEKSPLDFFD